MAINDPDELRSPVPMPDAEPSEGDISPDGDEPGAFPEDVRNGDVGEGEDAPGEALPD